MNELTWQTVEGEEEVGEVALDSLFESDAYLTKCCEKPDLRFRRREVPPVSDQFSVVCRACGKKGEETDWSWEKAVAFWNIALWNPEYMGRKPLNVAKRLDMLRVQLNELRIGGIPYYQLRELMDCLGEVPILLHALVIEAEENRVRQYSREVEDA